MSEARQGSVEEWPRKHPNDLRPSVEKYEVRMKPHGGRALTITGIRPFVVEEGTGFFCGDPLLLAVMSAVEELEGQAPETWTYGDVDFAHWTISVRRLPDAP